MCGFVAYIGIDHHPADPACIARMLAVIRHRGPDDEGTYLGESVGFGFRRLAILDLTPSGHQPMTSPDGRFTIAFNGEIYITMSSCVRYSSALATEAETAQCC